jgi:dimethylargininase
VTLIALTRAVSDAIGRCELTHVSREPIDLDRARAQHAAYERALEAAGCHVVRVAPAHDLPDAVFVEDAAVVVDEVGIATRPGAVSRRSEVGGVVDVLRRYRDVLPIEAPGTIDGGDVLVAGRRVFIGRSSRTNDDAIGQVRAMLRPHGYDVSAVDVHGCLHLKSAAAALADDRLLVNPAWIRREVFRGVDLVEIEAGEPYAANIVRAGTSLIYPAAFPRTRAKLEQLGFQVTTTDVSELAKAEGAVTCCSVIFGV